MLHKIRLLLAALLPALLAACATAFPEGGELRHAQWLRMDDSSATIRNPWRPNDVLHRYAPLPEARRAVSATSLHAYLALRLGALDRLTGVMDADYIVAPELKAALTADGANDGPKLRDFGSSMQPNLELLRASRPDALFASAFENAGYGALETLGAPIIECADYMETTPLGRAEWMRFYGRILGKAARADSLFAEEEAAYVKLADKVKQTPEAEADAAPATDAKAKAKTHTEAAAPPTPAAPAHAPTLLVGTRQGQAWYVPSAQSYAARLYADAGFDYAFAHLDGTGSVALDFEAVFEAAREADVWIITYAAPEPLTYAALAAQDERYTAFRAFRERRSWACNTLSTPYYDVLPWEPATLLRELIAIARPNLLPGFTPRYFAPLAE